MSLGLDGGLLQLIYRGGCLRSTFKTFTSFKLTINNEKEKK